MRQAAVAAARGAAFEASEGAKPWPGIEWVSPTAERGAAPEASAGAEPQSSVEEVAGGRAVFRG